MSAHHQIDRELKLITTFWDSNTADNKFIDALNFYLKEVRNEADLCTYNELVDCSCVSNIELSVKDILALVNIAVKSDSTTSKTRLAIVVSSNMALSFGKMYGAFRTRLLNSTKVVNVFKSQAEALNWINRA